jgi:hypothetical protein
MYSGIVVSYKTIIEKVFRDFGFNYDIKDEESLEWIAEFMAHTNSGVVMEDKVAYISIKDGRGTLPADLHKIKQTAELSGVTSIEEANCGKGNLIPMRWSTDNFHARYHKEGSRDYTSRSSCTYTVGQGFIFPSFNCGFIALSYEGIPVDEEGYPTIPGEQQWITAASFYIAHKIAFKLWIKNEVSDKAFQIIERDKEWYFAQAVNHSKQWQNVDDAESVKNAQVRTIPAMQDHSSFFANMQLPEQRSFRQKTNSRFTGNIPLR